MMKSVAVFLFCLITLIRFDLSDQFTPLMEREQIRTPCNSSDQKKGVYQLVDNCEKVKGAKVEIIGFIKSMGGVVCCIDETLNRIEQPVETTTEQPVGSKAKDYCLAKGTKEPIILKDNILGGIYSSVYEFPHMVALGYDKSGKIKYDCGGSLISENFIITAAHCVHLTNQPVKTVRIGRVSKLQMI